MKYLSKEKLRQEIFEMAERCNEQKWKRCKKTFFVLCGVIYLLLLWYALKDGSISDINFINSVYLFVVPILVAAFLAGLVLFASCIVTLYMSNNAMKDEKAIARKMGEFYAVEMFESETKATEQKLREYEELKKEFKRLSDLLEIAIGEYRTIELYDDFENEEEKAEAVKYQLDSLKDWLKIIEMECKLFEHNKAFDEEVK